MTRLLRALLALLGLVPVATGLLGVIGGVTLDPTGNASSQYFDSEYRFLNGVWICVGLALWWSLRRPGPRALITRSLLVAMVAGGVARAVSVVTLGWPSPVFTAALAVELLVIPALVAWHAKVHPVPAAAG